VFHALSFLKQFFVEQQLSTGEFFIKLHQPQLFIQLELLVQDHFFIQLFFHRSFEQQFIFS